MVAGVALTGVKVFGKTLRKTINAKDFAMIFFTGDTLIQVIFNANVQVGREGFGLPSPRPCSVTYDGVS
jgi:hypothetical protein